MSDPIRLFVGVGANNEDLEAQAVLEFTARKHCSLPIEITWMRQAAEGPWAGWKSASKGRTPFTAYRWSLPSVCGYQGRAIYCDVDFFFFGDLADVWTQPIPKVALVRNPTGKLSTSFIVFDNARAKGHVPAVKELRDLADAHSTLLNYFRGRPELLAATNGNWDCPDMKGFAIGDPTVKACHYTRIETQLHLRHAIPRLRAEGGKHWYDGEVFEHQNRELVALFDQLLIEAQANGFTLDRYRVTPFDQATRKDFKYSHHVSTAKVAK